MNHYKTIIWDDLPIDQIINLIPIPSDRYMNYSGFVGPIDQNIANEIAQLLKIDTAQCNFCSIMLCYFPPGGKLPVHTDKPVDADPHRALTQCIILPLQNCEKVRWDWYEVTDPAAIYYQGAKETSIPMIPPAAGKIVGSRLCNQPFVGDIGTWHMLENPTDQAAMMLSIRLMPWSRQLFQECDTLPPISVIRLAE